MAKLPYTPNSRAFAAQQITPIEMDFSLKRQIIEVLLDRLLTPDELEKIKKPSTNHMSITFS